MRSTTTALKLAFLFTTLVVATFRFDQRTSSQPEPTAPPAVGAPQLQPPKNKTDEIIRNRQDTPISVIGEYDLGLNQVSVRSAQALQTAFRQFVLRERQLLGLSGTDEVRFVVKSADPVGGMIVADINQYVGELRVIDSDLTLTLADTGALYSVNGRIVANKWPQARATLTLPSLFTKLATDQDFGLTTIVADFKPAGSHMWQRKDGARVEVGWSIKRARPVWKVILPGAILWIDDATGEIVRRQSQKDHLGDSVTRKCDVRHRQWPRGADGRATSLNQATAAMVSAITCGGDDWFGTCYWHLKRQPFGFSHGIARIEDMNGGEREFIQSCTDSTRPSFQGTSNDSMREQGAFYAANQMRFFIKQNVWDRVNPNRDSNVDIHMDHPDTSTASFDNFWTSIEVNPSFGQLEVLMHEYGHYVVWTYDDVSDDCDPGDNEGDSLDETLANVFAEVYARDSRDINPTYGAISGFAGGNGPAAHTNANSLITQNVQCQQANDPTDGQAFQQAVWELLFNRDCDIGTCSNTSGTGSRIWEGASRDDVVRNVGAALGFALRALGQNITHSQVRAQMIRKIRSDSGDGPADRAREVFRHHGI